MIDDFAKAYLHDDLISIRRTLVSKLDGLCEFDVRRPHVGHADILREQIDGMLGDSGSSVRDSEALWQERRAEIERSAETFNDAGRG